MSTKKGHRRCPKCNRHMKVPSRTQWHGRVRGETREAWQTVCLNCVREHHADPFLHLRPHKIASMRERQP